MKKTKKALSLLLTVVMVLAMFPAITLTFTEEAKAYGSYTKNYSVEYYYPAGTKFVKNIGLHYAESESGLWNGVRDTLSLPDDDHLHCFGYNTYYNDQTGNAFVYIDLAKGTGSRYWIGMGYTGTTNPVDALKGVGVETSEYNGYSFDDVVQETVAGKQSNWYKANTGYSAAYSPMLMSRGAVDLNKGAGGATIYVYGNYDRNFAPPIDGITVIDTNTQTMSSYSYGYNGTSGAGWYSAVACNAASGNIPNLNANSSGSQPAHLVMYYHTPCTLLNTDTLRSKYAAGVTAYNNRQSYHSATSVNALATALNNAEAILSDLADGYTTAYTQTQINNAANAIGSLAYASYTVTLNANGGTGGTSSVTATYNSAMPAITPPTRSGYGFMGYFDAATGGTQYYTANGASARTWNKTANTTLYAQWSSGPDVTFENEFDFDAWAKTVSAINTGVALVKDFPNNAFTMAGDGSGRPQTYPYQGVNAYKMKLVVGHTYRITATVQNVGSVAAQGRIDTMQFETADGAYKNEVGIGMQVTQPGASRTISGQITMAYPYLNIMPYIQQENGAYGGHSGAFKYSDIYIQDITDPSGVVDTTATAANPKGNYNRTAPFNDFDFDAWVDTVSAIHTSIALVKDKTNDMVTMKGDGSGRPQTSPYLGSSAYMTKVIPGHTYRISYTVRNVGSVVASGRMDTMQFETYGSSTIKKEIGFGMVNLQPGEKRDFYTNITMEGSYLNLMPYIQQENGAYANSGGASYDVAQTGAFEYSNMCVQDISENRFDFDGWVDTVSAIHTSIALIKDKTNDKVTMKGDGTGRPQTSPYAGSGSYGMQVVVGHTYRISYSVKNVGSVAAQGRMDTFQMETKGGAYKKEIGFGAAVTQPGATRDLTTTITMEYPYFNFMPYIQQENGAYANANGASYDVAQTGAFEYYNMSVVDISGGVDTVGTLPAGPTMKNYHVDGWYDQQDANGNGTGTQYTANSVIGLGTKQLFAKWVPNVYTVTLNNQSATSAGTTAIYEKYNTGWYSNAAATTAASSITLPQKTGYTFGGYYTGTNGSGTNIINASGSIVGANTAITANTSIYAKWTGYPYTVAFIGGGGTGSMNNQSFVYGTAQNLTANTFTRAYTVTYKYNNGTADTTATATYSFKNWVNTSDTTKTYNDKQSVNNLTATYNGSVTLQAQWNSASVTLPTPSRTGYSFGGWYTNEACTTSAGAGGASYTPTANITLYAKWNPNGYSVNFDGNGATSGNMGAQSASYGTAATINNNAFSRAYTVTYAGNGGTPAKTSDTATYTFNGWAGSTATQGYLVNDDTHYNAAGGGAALHDYRVEGKTYVPGEEYVLEFEAWGTDGDYIISYFYGDSGYLQIAKAVNSQGTVATQSEGLIKTNITGSWTKYTVTYTLGATGDGSKTKIVRFRSGANTTYVRKVKLYQTKFVNGSSMLNLTPTAGGAYNMTAQWTAPAALTLPNATRDGYTFNGWYTAAEGGSKYGEAGASYAPTQSLTMTAQWTPIDYTIKYVVDGVETTAGYTTESTETLFAPTKDGYTFKGWAISDNTGNWTETTNLAAGTALAGRWGNVTLTARFEAKTYDITYNIGEGASAADQPLSVAHDGSYTFTVTVDEAHNRPMPTVTATGATLSTGVEGNVITVNLTNVTGPVTVNVPTAVNVYTLTITGEAGFTSEDNAKTVTHGSDLTFTVTLSEGYTQNPPAVTKGDETLTPSAVDGSAYTYTIENVTDDVTVAVSAQKNTYAVTFTSNDGADAPAARTIEHGENCSFSVTPKEGYTKVAPTVTVNNAPLAAASVTDGTYNYVIEEVKEAKAVVINVPVNVYTITWLDDDNTPLATTTAEHGETPVYPNAEPTKDATQQYTYTFAGWGEIVPAAGDATYTAGYTATVNKYSVTFVNDDGSELKAAVLYDYGTPFASVEAPGDPTKEATAQYTYTFTGWDPTPETITDNVICKATYSSAVNQYSVEFVDDDGRVIKAAALYDYGTSVEDIDVPADPTKETTAQYTYAFTGWSPALDTVTANVTYTATYSSTVNQYAIAFADDDGTVIKAAVNYDYGTEIADIDVPADPVKDATAQYTYTFTGWDPVLEPVTRAVTYKATYEATVNKYSVSFVDDDGTEIKAAVLYDYGTEVANIDVPADPTKEADAEFTYTFAGWNPALDTVTANVEYKATYDATARDYLVRFLNDDGNVLQRNSLHFGDTPVYVGEDPTKEATAQYTYTFAGWDKELMPITGNTDITATYTATVNKYTVTFKNDNGDQLQSGLVAYGDTPAYTEATPTKEATAQYTYTFKEWSPEVTSVTGPAEYTATYNTTVNQYTVQFVNYDGEVLKSYTLDYGTTPVYDGDEPVKPADAQYTYNFLSWDKEIASVTGNTTYTAVFDNITNKYAITFKNEDGTVLQQTEVLYGTLPVYEGADPTKEADAQYTYTFNGWDEMVALVTGEATYTATYSSTVNQYDITFKNENGSTIVTYTLDYGMTPVYKGPALAKESDENQHYSFAGWNTDIVPVVGAAEYTAVFTGEAHECNSGAVKTAATCAAEGEMLHTCTVCGRTKIEPIAIDPDNHTGETRVEGYAAPTEDDDGFSGDIYCASCGELLETGHTLRHTKGYCLYCGGYHEGIWGSLVTAIHGILWLFSRFLKR